MTDCSYKWEPSPHTADLAVSLEASDPEGLFLAGFASLMGLLGIQLNPPAGVEVIEHALTQKFATIEEGLVDFLNECIYLMDAEDLIPFKIQLLRYKPGELEAIFHCREVEQSERSRIAHIKATTYSGLTVKQVGDVYKANVIFDT